MAKEKKIEEKVEAVESQPISIIDSQETAEAFFKSQFKAPEGVNFAYVASDKNVFYPENESSAKNHAFKNKLQLFKIKV